MTVQELIDKLQDMPKDALVVHYDGWEERFSNIHSIGTNKLKIIRSENFVRVEFPMDTDDIGQVKEVVIL